MPLFPAGLVSPHVHHRYCHHLDRRPHRPPRTRARRLETVRDIPPAPRSLCRVQGPQGTSFAHTEHGSPVQPQPLPALTPALPTGTPDGTTLPLWWQLDAREQSTGDGPGRGKPQMPSKGQNWENKALAPGDPPSPGIPWSCSLDPWPFLSLARPSPDLSSPGMSLVPRQNTLEEGRPPVTPTTPRGPPLP